MMMIVTMITMMTMMTMMVMMLMMMIVIMIITLVQAVVVDDDDNCEASENCANLRSVDRFVGALRNVQRACSYSSLKTLIILIIVHAIMMTIKVITIMIVIMRAKTIRIACVQRFAPYSYSSSLSPIINLANYNYLCAHIFPWWHSAHSQVLSSLGRN